VMPQGSEFLGLLLVLRHFVDAQRAGRSVDPAAIRAAEPCLRSSAILTYFEDLSQANLIQRSDAGGWLLTRSLDSTDLLHVYRYNRYRLPLNPVEQAQASGIELPPELLSLLSRLARSLDADLGTRLDKVYPLQVTAPARPAVPHIQESET
jgi:membrane protein